MSACLQKRLRFLYFLCFDIRIAANCSLTHCHQHVRVLMGIDRHLVTSIKLAWEVWLEFHQWKFQCRFLVYFMVWHGYREDSEIHPQPLGWLKESVFRDEIFTWFIILKMSCLCCIQCIFMSSATFFLFGVVFLSVFLKSIGQFDCYNQKNVGLLHIHISVFFCMVSALIIQPHIWVNGQK